MNWDTIRGQWLQFRGRIKQRWGNLTDDDLERIEGRRDELVGIIQKRYGLEREEAELQIQSFEDKNQIL